MTWRHPSIAARLTVGLGVVALVVFSTAGWMLQRALESDLVEADRLKLAGKISVVLHFIDEAHRSGDRPALFHHLDDLRIGHDGLHVWLATQAGDIVYGASGSEGTTAAPGLPPGVRADLREIALPSASPWPAGRLRLALESGPRDQLLRSHLVTLVLVCALGVGSTVLLSWFVIGRCLRPASRLSAEASDITPRSLGRRLTMPPEGTELTGLVRAFNHALDRLEDAYAQLQGFNANVAHELRTPLASLITGTQITLASPRSADDLREVLISNLEELQLLNALVSDMLFLSRADRGDRAEGLERVALGAEADKAIRYCDALLQEAGVAADRSGDAVVVCNPPLVLRALVNLLTNAIRHTRAGERIRVLIEPEDAHAELSVLNPGPEIPAQVRAQMFDRFYRADSSRSRWQAGHGLGLAIVTAIARMHGGSVVVERIGNANRVGLTLPVGDNPSGGAATESVDLAEAAATAPMQRPTASRV